MKAAQALRADIRRAAGAKDLTKQADLAKAIGISNTYLSDILLGRRSFHPALLRKAAEALGVNPVRSQRWQRLGAVEAGWQIDARIQ